ncbi:hypothetical protein [Pseudobacteriovorax antillogorgiicola]|uniref:Type II secretion system (T2SS), protein E, N-terminal domain n=1 Tax=Pseudobacteriovorax antillogorgiicola TaxID=1513793 RepID=A0A1Y6B8M3_9BACT|nr:hypothetical protein [Pseudobacteriovorax antillogorgiicola]TCS59554.1 type II secretion system (T2SS) protein E [Pseudobacteriovorax antillogorgiicola]SME87738.1 Type II secretion system (T2SS), protein E, N-terminal domain [Pseudobacteriovorax antillogorgiicola]
MGGKNINLVSLSSLLEEKQALSPTNLQLIAKFKEQWGVSTYDAIVETHLLTERQVADILADYFRVTRVYAIAANDIKDDAFEAISFHDARRLAIFPLGTDPRKDEFKVVISDPTMVDLEAFLRDTLGAYQYSIHEKSRILDATLRFYPIVSQLPSLVFDKSDTETS